MREENTITNLVRNKLTIKQTDLKIYDSEMLANNK